MQVKGGVRSKTRLACYLIHSLNIALRSLRSQIRVVDQDTFLFGSTIRENISIAHPEASLEDTYNATNKSFSDGTAASWKAGTVLLEKFSANGETPLSRVVIRYGLVDEDGNNLEDEERTLPNWMHPERIYQNFNGKLINFEV